MKKNVIMSIAVLLSAMLLPVATHAEVAGYDQEQALIKAKADPANWMSYLPDDVFVAHVSIPGTHDTATAEGWATGSIAYAGFDSSARTQATTVDEQLAAGVRALDFRPGLKDGYLNCNHGIAETKLKFADAMHKLTTYLDAHPGEFFVIHLFRGNVPNKGDSDITLGKNKEADRQQYNALINELLNEGDVANYIVDYSPYLRVKDIRKKIVIFRRDKINFAEINKAGYLSGWPGDKDNWSTNSVTNVTHASDPTITGTIFVTDVSSPDSEAALTTEKNSIRNLYNHTRTQTRPNAAMAAGTYKPFWTMIFTSGEDKTTGKSGRDAYLLNASQTNPLLTELLRTNQLNNTAENPAGPCGIVFSDWVLTESYNDVTVNSTDIVPAIYENNFHYIKDFILDEELFANMEEKATTETSFWIEGHQYFMRNVATGQFLSSGASWGTRAIVGKYGIRISPSYDTFNKTYKLQTTQGNLGDNLFVDNSQSATFIVERAGAGKYIFKVGDKALTVKDIAFPVEDSGTQYYSFADGTTQWVDYADVNKNDAYQQWQLIEVNEYFNDQIADASENNPVDISYMIRGHRVLPNDNDNPSTKLQWTVYTDSHTTGVFTKVTHKSDFKEWGTNVFNDKDMLIHGYSENSSSNAQYTEFTLEQTVSGLPHGKYRLTFNEAHSSRIINNDFHFDINDVSYKDLLTENTMTTVTDEAQIINLFRTEPKHLITVDFELTDKDYMKLTFIKGEIGTDEHLFLDNFTLTYYGPSNERASDFLQAVLNYADAKMGSTEGWSNVKNEYQGIIDNKQVKGDGYDQALELYDDLRDVVYRNKTAGADYTNAIINNDFEFDHAGVTKKYGNEFGWDMTYAGDTGVKEIGAEGSNYYIKGDYGKHVYNTWDNGTGAPIHQTVTNLPAGHYKFTVAAVTGDTEDDRWVYLTANGKHSDKLQVQVDKATMTDVSFEFNIMETSDVELGLVGANADGTYSENQGVWYKADNFRLTYLGEPLKTEFYNSIQEAIAYATAKVLEIPAEYRTDWNDAMAPYHAIVENQTLEGDGTKEVNEIYTLMREHILSQREEGANLTGVIFNNSFENGDTWGWSTTVTAQSGVMPNSNGVYTTTGCDKDYLFNTYYWDAAYEKGYELTQTIPNVPIGVYKLSALLTSHANNHVFLTLNDSRIEYTIPAENNAESKTFFYPVELEITLYQPSDLTIGAVGGSNIGNHWDPQNGCWYKADNFELTLVRPADYIEWTMDTPRNGTLILPFDHAVPEGLTVHQLTESTVTAKDGEEFHLIVLGGAEQQIKAHVPYIVQREQKETPARVMHRVNMADTPDNGTYQFVGIANEDYEDLTASTKLTGVHDDTNIVGDGHYVLKEGADGDSFVRMSSNEGNTIAAHHAYIHADQSAAWLSANNAYFLAPDGSLTAIEGVNADIEGLVDIYAVSGVLVRQGVEKANAFDGLAPGIYILKAAGKAEKVYVK